MFLERHLFDVGSVARQQNKAKSGKKLQSFYLHPGDAIVFLIGRFIELVAHLAVGRSDTNEGRMLKESHTYEKHPT
jgi:hypothetical protein